MCLTEDVSTKQRPTPPTTEPLTQRWTSPKSSGERASAISLRLKLWASVLEARRPRVKPFQSRWARRSSADYRVRLPGRANDSLGGVVSRYSEGCPHHR